VTGRESLLASLLREKRAALGLTLRQVIARCEAKHKPREVKRV
jgi:hypothetical protein